MMMVGIRESRMESVKLVKKLLKSQRQKAVDVIC